MVLIVQLVLVFLVVFVRRRGLLGTYLQELKGDPGLIQSISRDKHGEITGRHLGIKRAGGTAFIVRRERFYHKVFKWVGMATELKVPDRELDRKYFFITDFPHHLEKMMHSSDLVEHIRELLAKDVKSIHVVGDRVWCVLGPESRKLSTYKLSGHVELLEKIHEDTRAIATSPVEVANVRRGVMAFGFLVAHATLFALGVGGLISFLFDDVELLDHVPLGGFTLLASVAVLCVWSVVIAALFTRTSWVCWVLADFMLWGVVGIVLSIGVLARDVNVNGLQAAPTVYNQPVLMKACTLKCRKSCGRRCTRREQHPLRGDQECSPAARATFERNKRVESQICEAQSWYEYDVYTPWWKDYPGSSKREFKADVSAEVFDGVRESGIIKVPVYPGMLGFEWLSMGEVRP